MSGTAKETEIYQKRPAKETCERDCVVSRDKETSRRHLLPMATDAPCHVEHCKRDQCISKETNVYQKRLMYIKRDHCISKETNVFQKRPIYIKRDTYISKETNIYQKRLIHIKRGKYISKQTHTYEKRPAKETMHTNESYLCVCVYVHVCVSACTYLSYLCVCVCVCVCMCVYVNASPVCPTARHI